MKKYYIWYIAFLTCIVFQPHSFGQTQQSYKSIYNWFDKIMGEGNTALYVGMEYKEKFLTKDGNHKFFLTSEYLKGDINYDGETFYDVAMKYDIYEDQIIVRLPSNGGYTVIQLIKSKIDSFVLNNGQFVNINPIVTDNPNIESGFYEIIPTDNNDKLLKKNKKIRKEKIGDKITYSYFKPKSYYLLEHNNTYYEISSKSNILKVFPEYRKEINIHFREYRNLLKTDPDKFFKNLIVQIDQNSQ